MDPLIEKHSGVLKALAQSEREDMVKRIAELEAALANLSEAAERIGRSYEKVTKRSTTPLLVGLRVALAAAQGVSK